jgi:LacI family transcriptional regulator
VARVRLDEVAADAGVSKATVSMVLNNNPLVAETTRVRVLESLKRTGYVYNTAAASLRKKRSNAIGLVVTTLTNPYFAEFAESIQAELDAQGMDVLLGISGDDPQRQARLVSNMAGRRVDGIVMVPAQGTEAEAIEALDMPTLLLARRVPGLDVDYVGGDNENGTESATDHLISVHGCRRLAFFGGTHGSSARLERLTGFMRAVKANDLEQQEAWRRACVADRRLARAKARELLTSEKFDGVVCYNDVTALGVMDAAAELGLVVGSELRVTGFDDIEEAAFASPSLTSVAVPAQLAGQRAAEMLLARISGTRVDTEVHILEARLRPRSSCGCWPPDAHGDPLEEIQTATGEPAART